MMKLIISSNTLLRQLRIASGILGNGGMIPILESFLFEVEDQTLRISATDTQVYWVAHLPVSEAEEGRVAVPAKMLLEILKTLPEQPIVFRVEDKENVVISSSYGNYKIAGHPADEFPKMNKIEPDAYIHIPAAVLQKALQKTLVVCLDEGRSAILSGINIRTDGDGILFAATDAQRIITYRRTDIQSDKELNLVIPKKPVVLLKDLLNGKTLDVSIGYTDKELIFEMDDTQLACRLIEGKFPNCSAATQLEVPNQLLLDRQMLLQSVQRVGLFAGKENHQIRLKVEDSTLMIGAEDKEKAHEAKETLQCQYLGDPLDISFSAKHLIDAIRNVDTAEIQLHAGHHVSPALVLPSQNDLHEEQINLITPLIFED